VPAGDILIHAGDITTFSGELSDLVDFNDYLSTLPHPHKILVAGNHDFCFERDPEGARGVITNATYLEDDALTVDGIVCYGSPWQPVFMDWAFNLPRGEPLREKWRMIPDNTDVLITHCPPFGILDRTFDGRHVGCEDLLERVREVNPKVHLFGHIHEARGMVKKGDTVFVNASMAFQSNDAFVVDI
jgi:predicted phosphohydrolase